MERVSITELRRRTSEIVRQVQQDRESFEITYRGEVVALLVPVDESTGGDSAKGGAVASSRLELGTLWKPSGYGI